ncbi:MAG TPA: ADP-ribosylation family protein [Longimicrobiales bacterium]|nr:ADP-ribosylation family protein [Longimicrobiales bacterium]
MTPTSPRDVLRSAYDGFEFPPCFFGFHDFVVDLARTHGIDFGSCAMQVRLGSAFDVFSAGFLEKGFDPARPSRYPADPPEFLTVIHGPSGGLHWGYYCEDRRRPELFVASYFHSDPLSLEVDGWSIFEAMRGFLERMVVDNRDYLDTDGDPFYRDQLAELDTVRSVLVTYDTGDRPETGSEYLDRYVTTLSPPTARTRDGIGIRVDPSLYRPLSNARDFTRAAFHPPPEEASTAQAEALHLLKQGFPGAAFKLGKDLWCYEDHRARAVELLRAAYVALDRTYLLPNLEVAAELNR